MLKSWILMKTFIVSLLVFLSIFTFFSQESSCNVVSVSISHSIYHSSERDSIKNIPLVWNSGWNVEVINQEDNTHEMVIDPRITLESSLALFGVYPNDPKIFIHQPDDNLYTWDFHGHNLLEYENCCITLQEIIDVPMKKPGLTLSRTVFPEVLTDETTLQKVIVTFKVEEPLLSWEYVGIVIGEYRFLYERDPLVSLRVIDKVTPENWWECPYPFFAMWRRDTASLEVGKTYTFEATFETAKSDKILGSPIFKPDVYVSLKSNQSKGSKTSNSSTIVYSDAVFVTFAADNVVTWERQIIDQNFIRLAETISGVIGNEPPFNVKIDADTFISPEILDLTKKERFAAYIRLPKGYDASNIDLNTIFCNGASAVKGTVFGKDNTGYKAEFKIQDLVDVPVGEGVTLTITGQLTDKTQFEGSTTIKIVNTQLAERAEKTFEEAAVAFNRKDYKSAVQLFSQAQEMYRSISNFTKVSECQSFIDRCSQHLEEGKFKADRTEALFNEGVSYFEQKQYNIAITKFEEALSLFAELDDEKKIEECGEWITSCKKELEAKNRRFCTRSFLIFMILLISCLIIHFKN